MDIDMYRVTPGVHGGSCRFQIDREARMDGVIAWFMADLCPGVRVGAAPALAMHSWSPVFFPVERAIDIVPGQHVDVHVEAVPWPQGAQWNWEVAVRDRDADGEVLCTLSGSTAAGTPGVADGS